LERVLTLPRKDAKSSNTSNASLQVKHPLKTKWQQKWIGLEVVHPKLQELGDSASSFCGRWFANDPEKSLLVIIGHYGSGKTHVARAIFKFALTASMAAFETRKWPGGRFPQSMYLPWPQAVNEFEQKNFSCLADAMSVELLVLDDIGAENDPWKVASDRLCQILSRRERMFTVVTSNIQPAEWADKFDGRIADRLLRNSVIVDLSGVPSYAISKMKMPPTAHNQLPPSDR
jgi:DNA replication protein DnaC